MTPDAIRAELHRQGLSQVGAAHLIGVDPRTMRRWVDGTRDMPAPACRLLLLLDMPDVRDRLTRHCSPKG